MGRDLGQLVQQRRHELELSRRDLAEMSGVSYPYVSQIETGDREPSLKTLHALAQVLEIPVEQMAGLTSPSQWLGATTVPGRAVRPSPRRRADGGLRPPRRAEGTSSHDALDMWRDKVMPVVERKLSSVPPVERIALLNELLTQAVSELRTEQAERSRPSS